MPDESEQNKIVRLPAWAWGMFVFTFFAVLGTMAGMMIDAIIDHGMMIRDHAARISALEAENELQQEVASDVYKLLNEVLMELRELQESRGDA